MSHRYYSARKSAAKLSVDDLYLKLKNLYLLFRKKDYFKGKAGITDSELPDEIIHEAAIDLSFQPFPIEDWQKGKVTEDHIFDTIEFLYDHVSKPGEWTDQTTETGWNYYDYDDYDDDIGKEEFLLKANIFLCDYGIGYELSDRGTILAMGADGLQIIFDADIIPYDEENVDSKVRNAVLKWRKRRATIDEKKEAIRGLADVFEWLKKTQGLSQVINKKDEAAIFEIANKFAVRHHNPDQKTGYDQDIWYSWMFHFYLATYHAAIRLLKRHEK